MARQNMYPSSWKKNFEIYQNFNMGLNTQAANESLSEKELPYAQNVNIGQRGTIERRTGMNMLQNNSAVGTGNAQGVFRFFSNDGTYKDVVAKNGYLYINGTKQTIEGFTGQLQTEREMNAVQYKEKMFIATGTKIVTFDGTAFKVLEHYVPDSLEAMYVGLNGLESSPEDFIKDRTSVVPAIDGVIVEESQVNNGVQEWRFVRYAQTNKAIRARAIVAKPEVMTLEYKFEKRNATDKEGSWPIMRDWGTSNTFVFTPNVEGVMQVRVQIREKGKTAVLHEYIVPKYMVKSTKNPDDEGFHSPTIHQCNQIMVYWERLYLYGDPVEKDVIYASDVQNFEYFPLSNTLRFENDRKEGITTIARFRDQLVVFTDSTIQVLQGKIPSQWSRGMVNSAIGCIAAKSVQSIDNSLLFLSKDGVFRLKSTTFTENNMNVDRLDFAVENITKVQDREACSAIFDSQYHLVLPSLKQRLRYYYTTGAWVLDTSEHMDLTTLFPIDGVLYGQKQNGSTVVFDESTYKDINDIYDTVIELKGMTFGEPYHTKKMKEVQVTVEDPTLPTNAVVEGFIDDLQVMTSPIQIAAVTKLSDEPQEQLTNIYKLKMAGKGHYVKVRVVHSEDKPFIFVGLGFIFKTKKP
jgi:hypothetical protein